MAKIIKLSSPQQELEVWLILGMYHRHRESEFELYKYCSEYFWKNYRGVFFVVEESAAEIFQNAFITLWEKIERRALYVENGQIMGKDRLPLCGSILTYFMSIAKIKYLEWVRQHPSYEDPETEMIKKVKAEGFDADEYIRLLYDTHENTMLEIIADVISHMSDRCNEILSKFYYEEKDLDQILIEIPSIESKNALKTKKYKCMEALRENAKDIYNRYLNS